MIIRLRIQNGLSPGHRFEDLRGLRRRRPHLPRHKSGMKTHFSKTDISRSLQRFPVKYDHSPHEV